MITKEMWADWKRDPVTRQFIEDLLFTRNGLKEGLVDGKTSSEREDCIIIGQCMGLKDAIQYAMEVFNYMELENAEGSGVQGDSESQGS